MPSPPPHKAVLCRGWYAEQAGSSNIDDFWTDAKAIQLYKDHVTFLMARVNSVTGVTYVRTPLC